jgi:hypothetical protein
MSHKIVLFADSSKPMQVGYIKDQAEAIKKWNNSLEVECQNELSDLLVKYSSTPGRLPAIMIFKNDVFKNYKHSKFTTEKLIEWLNNSLG